jgi:hypothetical protein
LMTPPATLVATLTISAAHELTSLGGPCLPHPQKDLDVASDGFE